MTVVAASSSDGSSFPWIIIVFIVVGIVSSIVNGSKKRKAQNNGSNPVQSQQRRQGTNAGLRVANANRVPIAQQPQAMRPAPNSGQQQNGQQQRPDPRRPAPAPRPQQGNGYSAAPIYQTSPERYMGTTLNGVRIGNTSGSNYAGGFAAERLAAESALRRQLEGLDAARRAGQIDAEQYEAHREAIFKRF